MMLNARHCETKHECTAKAFSVRYGLYASEGSLLGSDWGRFAKGYGTF